MLVDAKGLDRKQLGGLAWPLHACGGCGAPAPWPGGSKHAVPGDEPQPVLCLRCGHLGQVAWFRTPDEYKEFLDAIRDRAAPSE